MFDTYRRHFKTFANADAVAAFLVTGSLARARESKALCCPPPGRSPPMLTAHSSSAVCFSWRRHGSRAKACRYPSVRLEEAWIDRDNILPFVTASSGGNQTELVPDTFHAASAEQLFSLQSHELQSGWAEIQLKLTSRSSRVTPEWIPAVAPSLPPFQSWAQAATSWVLNRSVLYGADVPYSHQLVIVLPDTQARPELLSGGPDDNILVSVGSNDPSTDLELQYLFSRSRTQLDLGSVHFQGNSLVAIPACMEATKLDVYCLDPKSGIVSHRAYSWDELRAAGGVPEVEDDDIRVALAGGETEAVEFKPFVSPDSEKRREIVRTVVAFANGNGGRIFVGVNDQGEPEGRSALKRFRTNKDVLGLESLLAQLKKLIHDQIKPVPTVALNSGEVAGEPIGVIEVPPGDLIYSTHDNEILIRKGSTNRRPDPASELEPLLAARKAPGSDVIVDDVY